MVVVFVNPQNNCEVQDLFLLEICVNCRNALISQLLKTFTLNNENALVFVGNLLDFQKLCQG